MLKKLLFFAVAVADLEAAIKTYQDLFGLEQLGDIQQSPFGFRATMMGNDGQAMIELIQPSDPDSAAARLMRERSNSLNPNGEGLYLAAFEVDDLEKAVEQVQGAGGRVTTVDTMSGVAWVHPLSAHYALIALRLPRQ